MIKYVSLPCITQKYLKIIIPVYQSTANPLYVSQYWTTSGVQYWL